MPNEWTIPYTIGTGPKSTAFPDGYVAKRPYIEFFLSCGEECTENEVGVVDTGADFCGFPFRLLETLKIDPDTLPKANCAGLASAEVVFATVRLYVPRLNFSREIYAQFSAAQDPYTHMLGHLGFLENFVTAFDYQREIFRLAEQS